MKGEIFLLVTNPTSKIHIQTGFENNIFMEVVYYGKHFETHQTGHEIHSGERNDTSD